MGVEPLLNFVCSRPRRVVAIALSFFALSLSSILHDRAQVFDAIIQSATEGHDSRHPSDGALYNGIKNMHAKLPKGCDAPLDAPSMIHPASYSLYDIMNGPRTVEFLTDEDNLLPNSTKDFFNTTMRHIKGHSNFKGTLREGVHHLAKLQTCLYESLERFNRLAQEYNMTRWSAHGGSAMSAVCSHSMNLWDDDIDVTVSSCEQMNYIYDINHDHVDSAKGFVGKLIPGDDKWLLYKKKFPHSYRFKLKPVSQFIDMRNNDDVSGLDIMCFDEGITANEVQALKESGFRDYLRGDEPLQTLAFGTTSIQMVPHSIINKYVLVRYRKDEFCDFPFGQSIQKAKPGTSVQASQLEFALSNWYMPIRQRAHWATMIGKVKGQELTNAIPNLNAIEIENSIASPSACSIESNPSHSLKVIAFNAERGKYWHQFGEMLQANGSLSHPDVIILNEMDIGMARSGNVHTARKLAYELGMNYAWGLEYVELTNGNADEQAATKGVDNSLGLHGNAILTHCWIFDPLIVRDPLNEKQFSRMSLPINARGTEIRLGGRMGLFARVGSSTRHLIVGSVHKIAAHEKELTSYFNRVPPQNRLGIVTGGDEKKTFCASVGLKVVGNQEVKTWKAKCSENITGTIGRGDNFCSDLEVMGDETILPCHHQTHLVTQLSDHSIITAELQSSL